MYRGKPVYSNPAILERRTASMKGGPWHCTEHPTATEYHMGLCPQTEDLAARSLIVPIGPRWSPSDCAQVADAVFKVASHVLG
jgi:dTDP-4-amino-4,6-dideoxygalactose transaminase